MTITSNCVASSRMVNRNDSSMVYELMSSYDWSKVIVPGQLMFTDRGKRLMPVGNACDLKTWSDS